MKQFSVMGVVTGVTSVLLIASGYLQGSWTGRWAAPADFAAAEKRLNGMPTEFGDWKSLREIEPDQEVVDILQCRGYVHRVYLHQSTGAEVSAVLIAGPSGPTVAHLPEICYSSTNHKVAKERTATKLADDKGSVWMTEFRSNTVDGRRFFVHYGYSDGSQWIASSTPRFDFGGKKLLYKIQTSSPNAPAGLEFLNDFLSYWQDSSG